MTNTVTEARSVVVEREIPFPPEKIWRALTQPHLIEEWLMFCSAAQDASPLSGMVPMYLLMSVFHSAPWLKLVCGAPSSLCRK